MSNSAEVDVVAASKSDQEREEKEIKENCDYIMNFIDQLSKADYTVRSG